MHAVWRCTDFCHAATAGLEAFSAAAKAWFGAWRLEQRAFEVCHGYLWIPVGAMHFKHFHN
jgi:hypothetical protein